MLHTLIVTPGSVPGKNHGLKLILDVEVFDSGPGRDDSEGFTIGLCFWNDIPVMEFSGVSLKVRFGGGPWSPHHRWAPRWRWG